MNLNKYKIFQKQIVEVCNMMEAHQGVSAVFGVDSPNTFPILESICTNFEIPFITASWKPTIIRNPDQARALLNFHPEAELYAKGLAELVKSLEWSSFVIVYETEEGLVRLQEILKLQELERGKKKNVIIVKQLGPGPDYRKSIDLDAHTIDFTVLETTANITTVRIHDPSSDDFKNAIHRWQLTEFENRNIRMQLDPKSIKTETVLFHDAILLLSDSISDLSVKYGLDEKPISCKGNDTSINGFALRNYMRIRKPSFTLSGPISFNENGDRIKFNIYLVDMVDDTILATWFAGNKTLHVSRSYNATVDAAILNLQKIKVIVSSRRAHLAVCDLTITPERREVVDFSMPFMTLGISILYKKPDKKDINMFAFLDPFSGDVWIYTATLFLVISIVLYFISRMTPGDWENPHPCEDDPEELENIWDIKNCLWLTLGSIMTQGCDILPKGISSRIAVAMWWFFSLIMTSSYTANLAAFFDQSQFRTTNRWS
nr:glutamate receptor ionotropic, kainate 2-like [Leptinotarsa decemlineata]